MNRSPWLLPIVAFVAALLVTATVRHETAQDPAPPARAAKLRLPASEPPPALPQVVLAGVRDLPAPLATQEPTAPAPPPQPSPSPSPTPTPTAGPTPAPAAPAPAPPPPAPSPAPAPRLTPVPTFDDSGSGPVFDDDDMSP